MKRTPKYAVGQVVCIRPSTFDRIIHVRESPVGWAYSTDFYKPQRWFPEERLRPLTQREIGPQRKTKGRTQ